MSNPPASPWRIDDLAHRAGLTVDTVRYYQTQGLLPPAERCGRAKVYGPQHLERLERIRQLQQRRFSLAAIRALVSEDHEGLANGVFADRDETRTYDLDELVERSGTDRPFAEAMKASGLLRDPADHGRDAYDGEDLELLRAMAELRRIGIDDRVIVELGRIYADGVEATQRQVVDLFGGRRPLDMTADELAAFQRVVGQSSAELLTPMRRMVDYAHHRTMQRLALAAIERGLLPDPSK
ncbi:MAG TPA: MerR family transcriptional regulator [Acidimicrobiia bacterium]|nr:MerR family transcriptional regulator [Acidimicrobiia bacterium]